MIRRKALKLFSVSGALPSVLSWKKLTASMTGLVRHPLILLKADDLQSPLTRGWQMFTDLIRERNLKASVGLIGNSLEKNDDAFVSYVRDLHSRGNFEVWNHGYDHQLNGSVKTLINNEELCVAYHEFQNTCAEYQLRHLLRTQTLAKEKVGISIIAFGAPGNATDANTMEVIDQLHEIRVWFFGPADSTKLIIRRTAEIEEPLGEPSLSRFMRDYQRYRREHLLALQCHPNDWNDARMKEFRRIIEFLLDKRSTFILPRELVMRP